MNNNVKTVMKYGLTTFAICVCLFICILLIIAVGFPKTMGDFLYSLGMKYNAISFYEKNYARTEDINELHKIVNLCIATNKNAKLIDNYEKLLAREEYSEFINYVNNLNRNNKEIKDVIKSTLINEDDYLKNKYVKALIETDNVKKAIEFSTANIANFSQIKLNELGCFLVSNFAKEKLFLNADVIAYFSEGEKPLKNELAVYFENLINEFNNNLSADRVDLIATAKRINLVGECIKKLNASENGNLITNYLTEDVNSKVIEVNKTVADII